MSILTEDPQTLLSGGGALASAPPPTGPALAPVPTLADFQPLEPKNPDNPTQKELVERYNHFRASGGRNEELDQETLNDVLSAARGGTAGISEEEALKDPEKFYQLVYKTGQTAPLLAREIAKPAFWANAPFEVASGVASGLGELVKSSVFGGAQILWDSLQSINPFITQQQREQAGGRTALATLEAAKENFWILPQRLVHGAQDLYQTSGIERQLAETKDPADRERLERAEAEIIRNRMLRQKAYAQDVQNVQNDVAGAYRMVGMADRADAIMAPGMRPTDEERRLIEILSDPTNILMGGVGKAAGMVKAGSRLQRLEEAVAGLSAADREVTHLSMQRQAFSDSLAKATDQTDVLRYQKGLADLAPKERAAQSAQAQAAQEATLARAVVGDSLDSMGKPGVLRNAFGRLTGDLGRAAESLGQGVEKVLEVPGNLAERVIGAGASPEAKEAAGSIVSRFAHNALTGMAGAAVGGPVGAAFGGSLGALIGSAAGFLTPASGAMLRAAGRDLAVVGKQLQLGRQTLPYWKAVAENTTGLTSAVASRLDHSLFYAVPGTLKGAALGTAIGGGFGALESGGEARASLVGAGTGGFLGAAGGGLGQLGHFNSLANLRAAQIGDRSRFIKTLSPQSQKLFGALAPDEQLALSVYALAHPDLRIHFFSDPKGLNGEHRVLAEKAAEVTINVAGDQPLKSILQHEIGHHVAAHGLGQTVSDYLLGNPGTGQVGIFSKLDEHGLPIPISEPSAQGTTTTTSVRYLPDERFERYKADYNARKLKERPESRPEEDYGIAQEMFAELHAEHFSDPRSVQRLVRGTIKSDLVGPNVLANWFGKLGMGYDAVTGNPLPTQAATRVRGLTDVVEHFYKERTWRRADMAEEQGVTRVPPEQWNANPKLVTDLLDGAGILARDPASGKVIYDPSGLPVIKSEKAADADFVQFGKAVLDYYRANPRLTGEQNPRGLKLVTDRGGRQVYRGQVVPDEVFDHLRSTNQFNPIQINNWQRVNGITMRNDGTMMLGTYNTAGRGGRYATLGVRQRFLAPLYTEISPKTSQVNFQLYDPEELARNASKMLRRPKAKALWGDKLAVALDDVKTYLDNLSAARPGETGIGLPKKQLINELFGIRADANPYLNELTRRSPSVFKTFRLDRLNRIQEVGGKAPVYADTYEQVRSFMMPRAQAAEGQPKPEPAAPASPPASEVPREAGSSLAAASQTGVVAPPEPITVGHLVPPDETVLQQHPWLKDLEVVIDPKAEHPGEYRRGDAASELAPQIRLRWADDLKTLRHEMVHAVQDREGSPLGGSSVGVWAQQGPNRKAALQRAREIYQRMMEPLNLEEYTRQAGFDSVKEAKASYRKEYLPSFRDPLKSDEKWLLAQREAGFQIYRELPGERQARGEEPK